MQNTHQTLIDLLAPTQKSMVKISLQSVDPNTVDPLASHLQAAPYFENDPNQFSQLKGFKLFAQINFAHVPQVDPDLPTRGILQLYFSMDNACNYGLFFKQVNGKDLGFKVVFWAEPTLEKHHTPFSQPLSFDGSRRDQAFFPGAKTCRMDYQPSANLLLPTDEVACATFSSITQSIEAQGLMDAWYQTGNNPQHHIGGYAFFTQSDPRSIDTDWVTLLQIDTDDDVDLMWGDCGVANLFIPRLALRQGQWGACLYNWDCC